MKRYLNVIVSSLLLMLLLQHTPMARDFSVHAVANRSMDAQNDSSATTQDDSSATPQDDSNVTSKLHDDSDVANIIRDTQAVMRASCVQQCALYQSAVTFSKYFPGAHMLSCECTNGQRYQVYNPVTNPI